VIKKKIYIVIGCLLTMIAAGLPTSVSFAETEKNPLKKLNSFNANIKKLQMSEKKMRPLLSETFDKISEECCEKNFEGRERLLEIKENIEKCLNSSDKKCFRRIIVYNPLVKKPVKLLLLESVDESKELLLKNSRLRHDNQLLKESTEITQAKQKIADDFNKLKEAYDILEENNSSLKKRIEIMLKNYDSRIIELEKENAKIQEEYLKAYEMLPKYKQKQLQKESKSE
jgi:hypothetical protein